MKELVLYACEICGTQYSNQKNAIECEESHKIPQSVEASYYRSKKSNKDGYPDHVNVTFSDGEVLRYIRG